MKIIKTISLLLFLSFWAMGVNAQRVGTQVNENYEKNWSFGAGFNVVDDSGVTFGGISNVSDNWNFSQPFYVSAEYYLNNQFSFMAMLSTNKYVEGKRIDNGYIIEGSEANYFSADLNAKFYFRDIMRSYKFDPYVFLGFGYNKIGAYDLDPMQGQPDYGTIKEVPESDKLTINAGLGFNYWFSQTWGLNLNWAGKINTSGSSGTGNNKQYSLGVVYFLSR